jgi:hypothetical protein
MIAGMNDLSPSVLRAGLLAPMPAVSPVSDPPINAAEMAAPPLVLLPSPREILDSTPPMPRLCASYERAERRMRDRSRHQGIGLVLLVLALSVSAFALTHDGIMPRDRLTPMILSVAAATVVGTIVLGLLRWRTQQQARAVLVPRVRHAFQLQSSLPFAQRMALRQSEHLEDIFLACYKTWREDRQQTGKPTISRLAA